MNLWNDTFKIVISNSDYPRAINKWTKEEYFQGSLKGAIRYYFKNYKNIAHSGASFYNSKGEWIKEIAMI